ncbi:MAG: folate-binding protein YgfZ [Woeseiaceae bacterium]
MNNEWQQFLSTMNASIEENTVTNFALSLEEEQMGFNNLILADLSHYGLIEVSGDDAVEFLQGQLTNDIKNVTDNQGQLSAYCNPKGRILSNFRIFKIKKSFYLHMRRDILAATLKRLRMFVMRSKVELSDVSDVIIGMGIAGDNASTQLANHFSILPQNSDDFVTENGITLVKLSGPLLRYQAFAGFSETQSLWQSLSKDAVLVGENTWNLLTIRTAIPEVVTETVEAFVPQMVNLQAINSLSFTKGCYPGQEVVARMHYLGKLKRRLFRGSVKMNTLPTSGEGIFTNKENEQKIGQIVSASHSSAETVEFLAVLQIEKAENEPLHIGSSTAAVVTLLDLPYTLEIEEKSK